MKSAYVRLARNQIPPSFFTSRTTTRAYNAFCEDPSRLELSFPRKSSSTRAIIIIHENQRIPLIAQTSTSNDYNPIHTFLYISYNRNIYKSFVYPKNMCSTPYIYIFITIMRGEKIVSYSSIIIKRRK